MGDELSQCCNILNVLNLWNVSNIVTVFEPLSNTCLLDGSMGRPARQALRTFETSHFLNKIKCFKFSNASFVVGYADRPAKDAFETFEVF